MRFNTLTEKFFLIEQERGEIQCNGTSQNTHHVHLTDFLKSHREQNYKFGFYNMEKGKPHLSSTFQRKF